MAVGAGSVAVRVHRSAVQRNSASIAIEVSRAGRLTIAGRCVVHIGGCIIVIIIFIITIITIRISLCDRQQRVSPASGTESPSPSCLPSNISRPSNPSSPAGMRVRTPLPHPSTRGSDVHHACHGGAEIPATARPRHSRAAAHTRQAGSAPRSRPSGGRNRRKERRRRQRSRDRHTGEGREGNEGRIGRSA
ncbi:hypothetical protein MRB53_039478 [Persea americana]|nr:hypothetical protein MRB53_039478 [Persea americana]